MNLTSLETAEPMYERTFISIRQLYMERSVWLYVS